VRKINRNMVEGPMLGNIILYTVPIILTSVFQLLFNAADLVVVGRFCGSASVAAVGATGSLTYLIISLFIGLSIGSGVVVAQSIGENNYEKISRAVHTSIPIALVGGIVLTVVGIILSKPILILMKTPDEVLELSSLYMKIYFGGMVFNMLYNFGAAILRAAGDTKRPFIYLSLAGVLNVILNVIFVTLFKMDVAGVALATTISQAFSAALVLFELINRHDAVHFDIKKISFDWGVAKKILVIGLPSGIQSTISGLANVFIQASINSFGSAFVTGSASAANIEGFVFTSMHAFQQTALIFTGQNFGAKKFDRIKKTFFMCIGGAAICGLVLGVSAYVFGKSLLSIYITDSQEAINAGMIRFSFVALPYFLCGITNASTGSIRGMGASVSPMIIGILFNCVFSVAWIFSIFSIPKFHTPQILFLSYPISWILTFVVQCFVFLYVYKKHKKEHLLNA